MDKLEQLLSNANERLKEFNAGIRILKRGQILAFLVMLPKKDVASTKKSQQIIVIGSITLPRVMNGIISLVSSMFRATETRKTNNLRTFAIVIQGRKLLFTTPLSTNRWLPSLRLSQSREFQSHEWFFLVMEYKRSQLFLLPIAISLWCAISKTSQSNSRYVYSKGRLLILGSALTVAIALRNCRRDISKSNSVQTSFGLKGSFLA